MRGGQVPPNVNKGLPSPSSLEITPGTYSIDMYT